MKDDPAGERSQARPEIPSSSSAAPHGSSTTATTTSADLAVITDTRSTDHRQTAYTRKGAGDEWKSAPSVGMLCSS
jgi:hypothetical protein